jgi:hypothetical protein
LRHFDLILVLDYFRSAAAYLSIIKYLSPRFSVGLYVSPGDRSLLAKNEAAHALFVEECLRLGARMVGSDKVHTDLLIVQQRPYTEPAAALVRSKISARRRVGYLTLATSGVAPHDDFIGQFDLDKVYVPNVRLLRFVLSRRNAEHRYAQVDVEQVGLPFAKYPVYPGFSADYLVAAPTLFSFRDEQQKQAFLENALNLLEEIDAGALVVYKPHNGAYWDYLGPPRYMALARVLGCDIASATRTAVNKQWAEILYTAALSCRLQRRAQPLRHLTPYSSFALEAFLPGIRKGVIGGLSNTIWGTLYFGKRFYNCVDPHRRAASAEDKLLPHKDGRHLLDVNLEFFGVPFCGGRLAGGVGAEGIIMPEDLEGDLIDTLVTDVESTIGA